LWWEEGATGKSHAFNTRARALTAAKSKPGTIGRKTVPANIVVMAA
jgi:hypothetical protein